MERFNSLPRNHSALVMMGPMENESRRLGFARDTSPGASTETGRLHRRGLLGFQAGDLRQLLEGLRCAASGKGRSESEDDVIQKALKGLLAKAKVLKQVDRALGGRRSQDPLWETRRSGQWQGGSFTRWWTNKSLDLIVWYEKDRSSPVGFQLCYNKGMDEHAVTWTVEKGYRHNRIDDGETRSSATGCKMAAVLVPDGVFDPETVAERFLQDLGEVDRSTAAFVYTRLMEYLP